MRLPAPPPPAYGDLVAGALSSVDRAINNVACSHIGFTPMGFWEQGGCFLDLLELSLSTPPSDVGPDEKPLHIGIIYPPGRGPWSSRPTLTAPPHAPQATREVILTTNAVYRWREAQGLLQAGDAPVEEALYRVRAEVVADRLEGGGLVAGGAKPLARARKEMPAWAAWRLAHSWPLTQTLAG